MNSSFWLVRGVFPLLICVKQKFVNAKQDSRIIKIRVNKNIFKKHKSE